MALMLLRSSTSSCRQTLCVSKNSMLRCDSQLANYVISAHLPRWAGSCYVFLGTCPSYCLVRHSTASISILSWLRSETLYTFSLVCSPPS
jgi:hypothetical protein